MRMSLPKMQSWATWQQAMRKLRLPTTVTPSSSVWEYSPPTSACRPSAVRMPAWFTRMRGAALAKASGSPTLLGLASGLLLKALFAGHRGGLLRPPESAQLDYEGEIAIVIGEGGRRIKEADAWKHVVGYSCYNDGSIRDWQVATTQWTAGKNFWRTGGFGPWMVSADEIAPDQRMTLTTRLNGQVMQQATTDMMIHSIPRQIAYISTFIPLESGDVIVTGTPGGVGNKRSPQVFMKPGDVVEIAVDAIAIQRNGIRDEQV